VLVGCAVGGFVALMLVALLLIHIKRRKTGFGRPYNIKKRPSPLSNDDGNNNNNSSSNNNIDIDMMVDNDDLDNNDEERLVEINVARVIDFEDMVRSDDYDDDDDDDFVDGRARQSQQQQQQQLRTQGSWSWKPSAVASIATGNIVEETPSDDISPAKTASTADASSEDDAEAGRKTSAAAPPPPPPPTTTTKAKSIHEVAAVNTTAATAGGVSSYWTSFFHRTNPKNDNNESENSSNVPPELRSMGSSGDDGDESYLFGDGLLSDLEDGTSTVESFEQRPLQDYIVKKDMLESPATRVALNNGAALIAPPAASIALEKERRPSPVGSEGNFTTHSEEEEERRKNEVMIPNPYVVRLAYGNGGMTNQAVRSSACLLEPTDTSAATLAQRVHIEGDDPIVPHVPPVSSAVAGKQQGMIPKVSPPPSNKSWWRSSSQQEGKERQGPWPTRYSNQPSKAAAAAASAAAAVTAASAATATDAANTGSEDDDTFGPASSDGWDPADSELGSLGTLPNEEDLFQPTVEDKTGQTFLKNSVRNEATRSRTVWRQSSPTPKAAAGVAGSNPKTKRNYARKDTPDLAPNVQQPSSAPAFFTYVQDDAASLCSDESDVLKWDSEQVLL
jgi:hypothetical protein